jgi:hypothetical protein
VGINADVARQEGERLRGRPVGVQIAAGVNLYAPDTVGSR